MSNIVTIDFHGDPITAVDDAGTVYIAVKPISDVLGLDWSAQLKRTKRDPVLAEGMAVMAIPTPGGAQETVCLALHLLGGWLFGINAGLVRPDIRDRVLAYQRECYAALHAHFYHRRDGIEPPPAPASVPHYVKRALVHECRKTFGGLAARELWRELGLPITPAMNTNQRQGALQLEGGR